MIDQTSADSLLACADVRMSGRLAWLLVAVATVIITFGGIAFSPDSATTAPSSGDRSTQSVSLSPVAAP